MKGFSANAMYIKVRPLPLNSVPLPFCLKPFDKKYAKNFVDSVLSMYSFKTKGSNIAILEPAPGQETIVQDFDRTKLTRYYRKSHGFEEIDNQDYEVSSGAGSQAQSTSQPNGLFAPARIESYEGVPGLIAALPKLRIPARHEL